MLSKVKCSEYSYYISAVYLAPDVGKPAYDMFVEDMDPIVDSSRVTDRILVLGDFNLPTVEWRVQEDGSTYAHLVCGPRAGVLLHH
jgi:hypothetical protein